MNAEQVETLCTNLSQLLKNTIRSKILNHQELPPDYTFAEALIFWLADWLTSTNIVSSDQLRILLEEFAGRLIDFGNALEAAWRDEPIEDIKRLPVCKIGFLDRQYACMDGQAFFLDLETGKKIAATDHWPVETLVYNLTRIFVMYNNQSKKVSSAELGGKDGRH